MWGGLRHLAGAAGAAVSLPGEIERSVAAIHAAPQRLVYAFAGAGSLALYWLHAVAGSSRTVLEARDCYAPRSLDEVLQGVPTGAVSPAVATGLSVWAAWRAAQLADGDWPLLGVGCTAAIATDRARRGADRAFVAVVRAAPDGLPVGQPEVRELTLERAIGRLAQEAQVSRLVIAVIAAACGRMKDEG